MGQRNFLKVVDTLEKFQSGMMDKNSAQAKEFIVFKRQLYQLYEVQNRSVWEHEHFSFQIDRHNLSSLYKANIDFIHEMKKQDTIDQMVDYTSLKGYVFKKRAMNPRRVKGLGAFAGAASIYTYMPYLAAYLGSTVPLVSLVAASLYGMLAFAESQFVSSIKVIEEGTHRGLLEVEVGTSAFASKKIIVNVRDIQSVVSLHNDDYSDENTDGNVILIHKYFDVATN